MFKHIMVPVDLAHKDRLKQALTCAGDLAKHYGATVTYVGVTSNTPGGVAHNPKEYGEVLSRFAAAQGELHGFDASAHAEVAHDLTTDVDDALMAAVKTTGADLVIMASHVPNIADYVWPSNGGKLAAHAAASVMVVRLDN